MLQHDGPPRIEPAVARVTARPAFGKDFAAQTAVDGAPADAEVEPDPLPWPALAGERPHLLVLGLAPLVARTSQERDSFLRLGGREKESAVQARDLAAGLVDRAKVLGMEGEHHFQRLGQVLQQVEAVGDLHRRRGAATRALGVGAGAVACDHRDTGMRAQPRRQRVRLAIGQQRHRTAALQIHQHSAVSGALAQRPVVHPESGRGHGRRHGGLPNPPQQRVAAGSQSELGAKTHASTAAERQAQGGQPGIQAPRPARPREAQSRAGAR